MNSVLEFGRERSGSWDAVGVLRRSVGFISHNGFGLPGLGTHPDFHLADVKMLSELVLPFLADADQRQEDRHPLFGRHWTNWPCLAAWLVSFRDMSNTEAIDAVKRSGRNARESGDKVWTNCSMRKQVCM